MENEPQDPVTIVLRIPGTWAEPGELIERLDEEYELTPDALILPDGDVIEFIPVPPDDQFAQVFRTSCRSPANAAELTAIDSYSVNVVLKGPGGSLDAAHRMMMTGAAIIDAGGAGVFIDNSAMAHGGAAWVKMAREGCADAVSFGYVSVIDGAQKIWTMGMHLLGHPDLEMEPRHKDGDALVEVIRYVCASDRQVGDGHLILTESGSHFRVSATPDRQSPSDSPMFNPWGRLALKSVQRLAEEN